MPQEKKKILIIDDSEYNVEFISLQLKAEGYEVDTGYDGETCIQKAQKNTPDLILLDVMMPYISGYEVCRILKESEQFKFIPIILMTALSSPDDKVKGFEAGADDFLIKPLNSVEMLARIRNLLRTREMIEKQRRREQYESDLIRELDLREVRIEEEEKRKQFYKEAISAVTSGKLELLEREELEAIRKKNQILAASEISAPEDIKKARDLVEKIAREENLQEEKIQDLILCVSEAATNVIKHGEKGAMTMTQEENLIRVWIEDNGPGIDFSNLPKATLMKGYSTKPSLGYGFKIMLELLDSLRLCTDKNGTTLLLETRLASQESEKAEDPLTQFISDLKGEL
ncbi:MAG: response regulator [Firmicutes bacterium]|nr:response regulator [Bacillota bacterium]